MSKSHVIIVHYQSNASAKLSLYNLSQSSMRTYYNIIIKIRYYNKKIYKYRRWKNYNGKSDEYILIADLSKFMFLSN